MRYSIRAYLTEEKITISQWDDNNKRWKKVKMDYKPGWVKKSELKGINKMDEFEIRKLYDRLSKTFQDKDFKPDDTEWWLGKLNNLSKKTTPKSYRR